MDHDGTRRLDRHAATRIVKRLARRAGIDKTISPYSLRHSFITAALDAGVALRDVQEAASHADPRATMQYDRARRSLDRHATYIVAAFVAGAPPPSRTGEPTPCVKAPRTELPFEVACGRSIACGVVGDMGGSTSTSSVGIRRSGRHLIEVSVVGTHDSGDWSAQSMRAAASRAMSWMSRSCKRPRCVC